MRSQKSFTVIELLIVIAMIGLIASIVLVRVQPARERARIASALDFSHTLQNTLGADAVGVWNFDEGEGTTAKDISGYGNNGTIHDADPTSDTPHNVVGSGEGKYALNFDGLNDYVEINNSDSLNPSSQITFEVWINQKIQVNTDKKKGDFLFCKDRHYIKIVRSDGKDVIKAELKGVRGKIISLTHIIKNTWHHIVVTYDGSSMKLYLDGNLDTSKDADGSIEPNSKSVILGASNNKGELPFNGFVDEVRIYSKALTAAQIQEHYLAGLKTHLTYSK